MLDPHRKRVLLRLVEEDRGALGSQSIVNSRWLSERAIGCSWGSGINLFRVSCITEVDKFLTDAIDAQWSYSLVTEDLLQSSCGATDIIRRTFYHYGHNYRYHYDLSCGSTPISSTRSTRAMDLPKV